MHDLKEAVKWTLIALVVLALLIVGLNTLGITSIHIFGTRYENARREVFENSASYVQGKQQHLVRLHQDWQTAESESHRGAICSTARHEASTLKPEHLPASISSWECVR